ncbi:MAG: TonB-dependent receptor [Berkelbacteria bacterium GW2011_GWA2_35_9]|uniref:TonB-dependent receptor n=1 Tax=Berkelbacteria bacterium GW2011_GWA2_35_9 TaxID=1618333 RepID=A0A0G0D0I3_9BACT|nr:MAG: TonB-dependent receptor [Berkelbacteria bacterium GW2011_GWA2_35_9]
MKFFIRFIKPIIFLSLVILGLTIFFSRPEKTEAGSLTGVSVLLSDSTESTTSTMTLSLTNETALSAYSGRIKFQMYGPYNWQYTNFNFNSASIDSDASSANSFYISSYDWSGLTISSTANISAGTSITVVVNNIVNPSLGGYYYAHVWTSSYYNDLDGVSNASGDYNTAYVEIGDNTNLKGQILDPDGNPVAYTNIYINDSSYTKYYSTYTDKNGNYGFADLTAGSYYFNVYYYGYGTSKSYFSPDQSTVTVASSGATTKNASFLAANRTVSGKVSKNSSSGAGVTDAYIYAYKSGGSGWAQTTTDSNGNYTLQVPAGNWVVYVYPIDYSTATWTINNTWEPIDVSSSSKTKDFVVDTLSSTISGSIKKSDGTAMGQWDAYISFSNTKNQWFSAYLSSTANGDGSRSFSAKVTPSTYSVSGSSSVNTYAFPSINNFSVGDGETYDLGIIELTQKTDTISGRVLDNLGGVVAGASISAWKSIGGYDWGYATSDNNGDYTIYVTPGSWQVSVWGPWSGSGYDYISSGKPTSITVTSGTPATGNFTLQKATSTITGKIIDPDTGEPLSGYGSVTAGDGSTEWGNIWGSVNNGIYSIKVPAGTWTLTAQVWHADYSNPDSQVITIGDYETKTADFTLLEISHFRYYHW